MEGISTEPLDEPGAFDILVDLIGGNWVLYSLDRAKRHVSGGVEAWGWLVQHLLVSPGLHIVDLGELTYLR